MAQSGNKRTQIIQGGNYDYVNNRRLPADQRPLRNIAVNPINFSGPSMGTSSGGSGGIKTSVAGSQPSVSLNPVAAPYPTGSYGPTTTAPDFSSGYTTTPTGNSGGGFGSLAPNQSSDYLRDVFNRYQGGTINQFNTAANRLRERLDSASVGQQKQATDYNLNRGFGNSGAQQRDMYNIGASNQNAYATGLADLENTFEQSRLASLGGMFNAANAIGQNQQFYDKLGSDNYNEDQRRRLQEFIAKGGWSSSEKIASQGTKSAEKIAGDQMNNQQIMDMIKNYFQNLY